MCPWLFSCAKHWAVTLELLLIFELQGQSCVQVESYVWENNNNSLYVYVCVCERHKGCLHCVGTSSYWPQVRSAAAAARQLRHLWESRAIQIISALLLSALVLLWLSSTWKICSQLSWVLCTAESCSYREAQRVLFGHWARPDPDSPYCGEINLVWNVLTIKWAYIEPNTCLTGSSVLHNSLFTNSYSWAENWPWPSLGCFFFVVFFSFY